MLNEFLENNMTKHRGYNFRGSKKQSKHYRDMTNLWKMLSHILHNMAKSISCNLSLLSSSKTTNTSFSLVLKTDTVEILTYGKDTFQTKKDSLAVAVFSIGWACYVNEDERVKQIQELAKDFNTCMLYLPNDKYLNDYFKHVERIKGNMYLVSNL